MSKAFTKEDDAGGFVPPPSASVRLPSGRFRLTRTGQERLLASTDEGAREALARAEIVVTEERPPRAALGVVVHVRSEDGRERAYRLVSAEEHALLGEGCSVQSPLGLCLLGAAVGDVRELRAPKGTEELAIIALLPG